MRHKLSRVLATMLAVILILGMVPFSLNVKADTTWTVFNPNTSWPSDVKNMSAIVDQNTLVAQINAQFKDSDHDVVYVLMEDDARFISRVLWRMNTTDDFILFTDDPSDQQDMIQQYSHDTNPVAVYVQKRVLGNLVKISNSESVPKNVFEIDKDEALEKVAQLRPESRYSTVILSVDGETYKNLLIERNEGAVVSYVISNPENPILNESLLEVQNKITAGESYYFIAPPVKTASVSSGDNSKPHSCDDYDVEWSVGTPATETTNGVMVAKCKGCGAVIYEAAISPMTVWMSNITTQIRNAKPGTTVVIDAHDFKSIHRSVLDAFRQNPNVNLQFNWKDENNVSQTVVIPAGATEKLNERFNLDHKNVDKDGNGLFFGFKALVGQF